jgi:hypothetical protein
VNETCLMIKRWPITIVALLFVGCVLAVAVSIMCRPTSDDWIIDYFERHRTELDQLVSIVAADQTLLFIQRHSQSNTVILVTEAAGHLRITREMGQDDVLLQRLFDAIGCDFVSKHNSEIIIAPRRSGIEDLYPGGYKVIVFRSTQPDLVVDSLDDFRRQNPGRYGVYRSLVDAWYIKYKAAH